MDLGAIIALVGFALVFAFAVWLGLRERRALHRWLDLKVSREGWRSTGEREGPLADRDWHWLRSMGARRDVGVDRLAINPGPGTLAAGFTLVTRGYGERLGARRHVGVGLVARLPHSIAPPLVAVPGAVLQDLRSWFYGLDLPSVSASDERLAQAWSISSPEPAAAATKLKHDARLRAALMAVFEKAVWDESKSPVFILELNGDRAALLGGPKTVGRDPFSDLEAVASVLTDRLHLGRARESEADDASGTGPL